MSSVRLSVFSLSLFLVASLSQAQWRSVHAVKTTITAKDGSVHTNKSTSEYFRSKSGSELTITDMGTPDGMLTKKVATLYDADGPAQYSLDYATKTAYLIVRLPMAKPFRTNRGERHPELKHATYDGLDCVLLPIMSNGQRIGTAWLDDKDDLEVKSEFRTPGAVTTSVLSNITFDSKSNPEMFRIPVGFRIDTSRIRTIPSKPGK